jgi:hypothetical protein
MARNKSLLTHLFEIFLALFMIVTCAGGCARSENDLFCEENRILSPNNVIDNGLLSGPLEMTAHFQFLEEVVTFEPEDADARYAGTQVLSVNRNGILENVLERTSLQFAIDADYDSVFNTPSEYRSPTEHFVRDKVLGCQAYSTSGEILTTSELRPSPTNGIAEVNLASEPGAEVLEDESVDGYVVMPLSMIHYFCRTDSSVPGNVAVRQADPTPETWVARNGNNWPVDINPGDNNGVMNQGEISLVEFMLE